MLCIVAVQRDDFTRHILTPEDMMPERHASPPDPKDKTRDELADLLASLAAIGRSMQEPFDPQGFLAEFSARVRRLVPHDRLMIAYHEEGGTLSVFAEHGPAGLTLHEGRYTIAVDPAGRYSPDDLALRPVLAGEAMLVQDFLRDPRFPEASLARLKGPKVGLRSRLAVPLWSGGRIIGALVASSLTPESYTAGHARATRQVADLIGPFIENTVLLHRERRRRRRLRALAALAHVIGASLNVKEIFARLGEAVRRILDFDVMTVALVSTNGRDLEYVAKVDTGGGREMPSRVPLEHLSFSARVEAGEAVLIPDAPADLDPQRPGDRRIIDGGGRSCLIVPLRFGEHIGGGLYFGKRQPHWFDRADVEIAAGIASQVVAAVQHQRLAEEQVRVMLVEGRARQVEQRLESVRSEPGDRDEFDRIIGRAPALREALGRAAKVAPTETTVLLTGESGTGKELVARAIHHASLRVEGPFVAINCAALPDPLVESELFGHERGAFTGADRQKPGRFELAGGGTLFLDEIAGLSPGVQAKLLRVLQDHEFQRVGGTTSLCADVRLVAATNRDLERAMESGQFRQDLYYRLNVFSVHLPPLRERGDDVVLLATHFLRELGERIGRGGSELSSDAHDLLRSHRWPGNIRELENAVERALIVSDGGPLSAEHFGIVVTNEGRADGGAIEAPDPLEAESLAELEKRAIFTALRRVGGNKSRAAAALGITRTQLYTRLRRFRRHP